ncbi:NAD-dependent protein deacylase [Bacillus horti]|uniref:NAD-dependent protein deacylase n=1 Tax=Caldalkalibacillus horti TaxID=77523 RepID=UPI0027D9292A|nr:NAD-dependent protein deacylase [Bacillus horti]
MQQFKQWVKEAKRIVVLSGAGMSTESGIPDFRSTEGVWTRNQSREELMSLSFLERYPDEFWPIYKDIFQLKLQGNYVPNQGHYALKKLEDLGKQVTIVTQNVDGLHQVAGSTHVYEVHGTLQQAFCPACQATYDIGFINNHDLPMCTKPLSSSASNSDQLGELCQTILHPGVVLFEDQVRYLHESVEATTAADLFLVLGSSLQVGPINQLAMIAQSVPSIKKVILNREATMLDHCFDLVIHNEIGAVLGQAI